jgi:excisionase family DNA binding protein
MKYLKPDEYAEAVGVTGATIRNLLRKGKIKGIKIGSQWRIPEKELSSITQETTHE